MGSFEEIGFQCLGRKKKGKSIIGQAPGRSPIGQDKATLPSKRGIWTVNDVGGIREGSCQVTEAAPPLS